MMFLCIREEHIKSRQKSKNQKDCKLGVKERWSPMAIMHECVLNSSTSNQFKAVVFDPRVTHYGTCILYIYIIYIYILYIYYIYIYIIYIYIYIYILIY